ncbi:hypothetical protein [Prosthecobacter sp.]|uniref:hypothetical protein n=1 Tax=Prosthecobacter sp. TaxID=1965333 RepID=UPI0037840981
MNSKKPKPKAHVKLTTYWGNDDAESTIKVSRSRWKVITEGGAYETTAWGWYEGGRFSVSWQFQNGSFSVLADDGLECIIDCPIEELIVQTD